MMEEEKSFHSLFAPSSSHQANGHMESDVSDFSIFFTFFVTSSLDIFRSLRSSPPLLPRVANKKVGCLFVYFRSKCRQISLRRFGRLRLCVDVWQPKRILVFDCRSWLLFGEIFQSIDIRLEILNIRPEYWKCVSRLRTRSNLFVCFVIWFQPEHVAYLSWNALFGRVHDTCRRDGRQRC